MLISSGSDLVHGIWTPLERLIEQVRASDGVTGEQIDCMLHVANEHGLVAGFKGHSPDNHLLAPVIVPHRESLPATFAYGRELLMRACPEGQYNEWHEAYARMLDDNCLRNRFEGDRFVRSTLRLAIVHFGRGYGPVIHHYNRITSRAQPAGLEPLFAATQHPGWLQQMDGMDVPFMRMEGLLLNVRGYDRWSYFPTIRRVGSGVLLYAGHIHGAPPCSSFVVPQLQYVTASGREHVCDACR